MYDCWLGYRPAAGLTADDRDVLARVAVTGASSPVLRTALAELIRGLSALTGNVPAIVPGQTGTRQTVPGQTVPGQTVPAQAAGPHVLIAGPDSAAAAEAMRATGRPVGGEEEVILIQASDAVQAVAQDGEQGQPRRITITSNTDAGCLHAVFAFLRRIQAGQELPGRGHAVTEATANKLRMVSHWDNIDGTIERGYAGKSIFFADGRVVTDLIRVRDYARLLASVGVNAVAVNNVNVTRAAAELLTARQLPDLARLADVFRDYGIRLFLSVSFDSPIVLGGLRGADPLDPPVADWWRRRAEQVYEYIPDLGGFQVKADSESRPGPSVYGRTQAEGANMLADALRPYNGTVVWRAFVYDCWQDWRDRGTDRARACYDTFMPLDGKFAANVVVQTKLGPMDFQVREPASPLLTALRATNQVIELQITQEYTGQQKDLCFLHPQWREVMNTPATVNSPVTVNSPAPDGPVSDGPASDGPASDGPASDSTVTTLAWVVSGQETGRPLGGVTGVANVGDDPSWTGHVLAQANLYAFGRLAWNPELDSRTVAEEWVTQTFGTAEPVASAVTGMLLDSWGIYESYTAPLGVGWMITPHTHYGPDIDGYEYSRWGTYHFADRDGIGVDRTVRTGTGFTAQYEAARGAIYDDISTCPDELLLFFHHVPYGHVLRSGQTVIQHIYDTHFDGEAAARELLDTWLSLEPHLDRATFANVRGRLELQVANAREWRDIVNTYFLRKSGIRDERGRRIF